MELKGSKTEANLWIAFAGESQARNKYDYFASKAKKEGYEQIAAIFQETALNEKEHAKLWFKALSGIGSTEANLAAAAAGAHVTHVDASKGMVAWAKENAASSELSDKPIRWLVDDCVKFVEREIRRGNHYDAIIMDPPSYGRGPKGEIWKIEDAIHPLIKLCTQILSEDPLFFLINSYTTGLAPAVLTYMLGTELKSFHGHVDSQEIGLPVTSSRLILPCGASGRWEADH